MTGNGDAIDAAIEAERTVRMITVTLNMQPHGRPAVLQLPTDITPLELVGVIGFLTTQLGAFIREHDPEQGARARLILPT